MLPRRAKPQSDASAAVSDDPRRHRHCGNSRHASVVGPGSFVFNGRAEWLMNIKPAHTLYVCYFGLREPLVQTQVLPYLRQLQSDRVTVSILTFEPRLSETWTTEGLEKQRAELAAEGITWH